MKNLLSYWVLAILVVGCNKDSHVASETIPERELPDFWFSYEDGFKDRSSKFMPEKASLELLDSTRTAVLEEATQEEFYSPAKLLAFIGKQTIPKVTLRLGLNTSAARLTAADKHKEVYDSIESTFAGIVNAITKIADTKEDFDVFEVAQKSAFSCFTEGMNLAGSVSPAVLNGISAALARGAFLKTGSSKKSNSKGRRSVAKAIAKVLIDAAGSEDTTEAIKTIVKIIMENSDPDVQKEILKELTDGIVESIAADDSLTEAEKSQKIQDSVADIADSIDESSTDAEVVGDALLAVYEGLIDDLGSIDDEDIATTLKDYITNSINSLEGLTDEQKSDLVTAVEEATTTTTTTASTDSDTPDLAQGTSSGDVQLGGGAGTADEPTVVTLDEDGAGSFTVAATSPTGYDFLAADFNCLGAPGFVSFVKDSPNNNLTVQTNPGKADKGIYVFKCTVNETVSGETKTSSQFWIKLIVNEDNDTPTLSSDGVGGSANLGAGDGSSGTPYLITIEDGQSGSVTLTASDLDLYDFSNSDLSCTALPAWITATYDSPDDKISLSLAPNTTGVVSFNCTASDGELSSSAVYYQVSAQAQSPADINIQIAAADVASAGSYGYPIHFINTGSAIRRTISIQNLGTADLTMTGVVLAGADAADFTLVNDPSNGTVVTGGNSYTYYLDFEPGSAATPAKAATMTITSDDGDEGTYVINLTGTAASNMCGAGNLTDPGNPCVLSTTLNMADGDELAGAGSLTIASGGSISAPLGARISITMAGDVTVNGTISANATITAADLTLGSTGSINADYLGYARYGGPGYVSGGSSSHGGYGRHPSSAVPYGSPAEPDTFGSGSNDVDGGGAIKLVLSGTLSMVSPSIISANGKDSGWSSSGGSIWINAASISGDVDIQAVGGSGSYGGGGGRIAILSSNQAKGNITADSGVSSVTQLFNNATHHGTVYISTTSIDTICDSGTLSAGCTITNDTTLGYNQTGVAFVDLTLASSTTLKLADKSQSITTTGDFTIAGDLTMSSGSIAVGGDLSLTSTGSASCDDNHLFNTTFAVTGNSTIDGPVTCNISSFTTTNISIGTGGTINASGMGYPIHNGPGYVNAASSSHGGYGRHSSSAVPYGDATQPTTHGSGSNNDSGGGMIKISASGTLTFTSPGQITANGVDGSWASSGGSIWLTAGSITGDVDIQAKGGSGSYGGGGGRIAIITDNHPKGNITADTGTSTVPNLFSTGDNNGSVYININDNDTICDSGTIASACIVSGNTTLGYNQSGVPFTSLTLANATNLKLTAREQALTTSGDLTINGDLVASSFNFTVGGNFTIASGATATCSDFHLYQSTLAITGDTVVNGTLEGNIASLSATNLSIGSSGSIQANGIGYPRYIGPGYTNGGSSSHGGYGRHTNAAVPYGDPTQPTAPGSGSNDAAGGGNIKIVVTGVVTFVSPGKITANGYDGISWGAAGGSIWINTGTFSGDADIQAQGGSGSYGAGGGRIAIYSDNQPKGIITADAGTSTTTSVFSSGQNNGSVYISLSDNDTICDSGTIASGCTISQSTTIGTNQTGTTFDSLVINSGVTVQLPEQGQVLTTIGDLTVNGNLNAEDPDITVGGNFTMGSSSSITCNDFHLYSATFDVTGNSTVDGIINCNVANFTTSNLTIGGSGSINANEIGYPRYLGSGYVNSGSSSHGGYGRIAVSAATYGLPNEPVTSGSGSDDGPGGGYIKISATGVISVTAPGKITANGYDGISWGAAGGSIWITTGTFSGVVDIQAKGGSAAIGGGGGRISVTSDNQPKGNLSADAGSSTYLYYFSSSDHNGTVYIDITDDDSICDSGTVASTCTLSNSTTLGYNQTGVAFNNLTVANTSTLKLASKNQTLSVTTDLTVNGDLETSSASITVGGDLTMGSGSTFDCERFHLYSSTVAVTGDSTIDGDITCNFASWTSTNFTVGSGASLSADGLGYPRINGPGYLNANSSSHGGYGRVAGALSPYGSEQQPVTYGSGSNDLGGGGVIKILASGTTTITSPATISADGLDSYWGSSGGSIWIDTGSFAGSGSISATGGSGSYGGGGGRIALYHSSGSLFAGSVSAASGTGGTVHPSGSDGTEYERKKIHYAFATNSTAFTGNLGGISGANTSCQSAATTAGLSGTWEALISDSSANAVGSLYIFGPVYNLNPAPELIASNATALWSGTLTNPIDYDEDGTVIASAYETWTGTLDDGTEALVNCSDWSSSGAGVFGSEGDASATGSTWVEVATSDTCDQPKRLYCISQ